MDSESDPELTRLPATELASRLAAGELTAVAVTQAYLARIEELDRRGPTLNAVLELNPAAIEEAAALDAALTSGGPRGPLHGVPVLLKGNIDVRGLSNSAGSAALADHRPEADAHIVTRLRQAGAVILGTTNLSEWANFRDGNSTSGWSSLGGQTRNPHVLDRNPCGSSSGSAVAVAARLAPLAIGTETNGSIVCPAAVNGVVGIKPSSGLVSRSGIIPIAHTQDTAGPLARSVADAALLLEAISGHDPADPGSLDQPAPRLMPASRPETLAGRRLGVLRSYLGAGRRPQVEAHYEAAVAALTTLGAELVDPIQYEPDGERRSASYRILLREFKDGLNTYLTSHGLPEERGSLAALIAYNDAHAVEIMPHFDQSIFREAEALSGLDDPEYVADVTLVQDGLRHELDAIFDAERLDALLVPVAGPAWKTDWVNGDAYQFGATAYLAAVSGYPSVALPAGSVGALPVGIALVGRERGDAALIELAMALEAVLPAAPEPAFTPTLEPL